MTRRKRDEAECPKCGEELRLGIVREGVRFKVYDTCTKHGTVGAPLSDCCREWTADIYRFEHLRLRNEARAEGA